MSDWDWDKHQRQLDRANPGEIRRESDFLRGLAPAEVDRQNQIMSGTQTAAAEYSGAMMDEENAAEQRRRELWEDQGLHAWEVYGTKGPDSVQAPSGPSGTGTKNPQMLAQLTQQATSLKQTEMQAHAQIMSAALSSGANMFGAKTAADASMYGSDIAEKVGLAQVDQQKVGNVLRERELVVNAERLRTMSEVDKQQLITNQFKAMGDVLPKMKMKTIFGEIEQKYGQSGNQLMAWFSDGLKMSDAPPWMLELSNQKLTEMAQDNMVIARVGTNIMDTMHTAGSHAETFLKGGSRFLGDMAKGGVDVLKGLFN